MKIGIGLAVTNKRNNAAAPKNYTTFDPAKKGANITLSNGNLTASGVSGGGTVLSVIGKSAGKHYMSFSVVNATDTVWIGIANASATLSGTLGSDINGWGYRGGASGAGITNNNSSSAYGAHFVAGDKVDIEMDMDNKTLKFWLNGAPQGTAATGLTGTWFAAVSTNGTFNIVANFGATTLPYTPPAGDNAGLYS